MKGRTAIKTAKYLDHMFELFAMQILALAHIKETENVHIAEEDYRLRRPDIIVQVSSFFMFFMPCVR